ncbi:MAG: hypothetical protein EOO01_19155 [Chitinophagaceae bacterium]|nr:MAG: hypothetical protein EOO01_19155 [Chitinophagaceae bacterium]
MKKITLIVALAFLGFSNSNAQIQKGNVLVGGNFANINVGLDEPNILSIDVTPKAAWFIQNNVALGGYVNFGLEAAKHSTTTTSYGVGALGRYYTGSEAELINHSRFFGEATVGFGGVNAGDAGNTNGLNLSVGPGFAYFITPNIGLELLLKYNGLVGFGSEPYQSNLNLSFGFQIYLPGRSTAQKVEQDVKQ